MPEQEQKPKVETRKPRRPIRAQKKEFTTSVVGLELQTLDIGNVKYAAKYRKSLDAIASYVQREYKCGSDIAQAMRELALPSITLPTYPVPAVQGDPIEPALIYIWQQEVQEKRKQIVQLDESKKGPMHLLSDSAPQRSRARFEERTTTQS